MTILGSASVRDGVGGGDWAAPKRRYIHPVMVRASMDPLSPTPPTSNRAELAALNSLRIQDQGHCMAGCIGIEESRQWGRRASGKSGVLRLSPRSHLCLDDVDVSHVCQVSLAVAIICSAQVYCLTEDERKSERPHRQVC